eukprot:scaffold2178_cov323-Prasinococcus_capsulatus_cf.AAC.3
MSYGSGLLGQKLQAQRSLLLLRKISRFSVGLNLALILLLALLSSYGTLLRPRASEVSRVIKYAVGLAHGQRHANIGGSGSDRLSTELQWDAERGTLMAELGKMAAEPLDNAILHSDDNAQGMTRTHMAYLMHVGIGRKPDHHSSRQGVAD